MDPKREASLLEFVTRVTTRLLEGEKTYQDRTVDRPLPEIIEELRLELLDQAAYAFTAFERLAAVEKMASAAERSTVGPEVLVRRPGRRDADGDPGPNGKAKREEEPS